MIRLFYFLLSIHTTIWVQGQSYQEYHRRASAMQLNGEDSTLFYFDKAIEVAESKAQELSARIFKCNAYGAINKIKEGIAYCEEVFTTYFEEASENQKILFLGFLSDLYGRADQYDLQIYSAKICLERAEKSGRMDHLHMAHNYLFIAYHNIQDIAKRNFHGKKAFDYALKADNKFLIHQIAFYLFSYNRDSLSANPFAGYLIEYLNRTSPDALPKDGAHAGFEYLTEYNITTKEWEEIYRNSLDHNDHHVTLRAASKLITAYINDGRLSEALLLSNEGNEFASTVDEIYWIMAFVRHQSEIYELQNETSKAMKAITRWYEINDSLKSLELLKNIDSLSIKYETAKKDQLLSSQEVALYKSQRTKNILSGLFIFLISLGGLIYYNQRRKFALKEQLMQSENQLKEEKINRLEQGRKISAMDMVIKGETKERKRIASELHDSLGALLATAKLQFQTFSNLDDHDKVNYKKAEKIIEKASKEVRRISHAMMPDALVNMGLIPAIEDLASEINHSGQIQVTTHFFDLDEDKLSDEQKNNLYRIIQELTSNVVKHSFASEMIIQICQEEGKWIIDVEDNGIGFNSNFSPSEGIGLQNIKSRVGYLNGTIQMDSSPSGTSVHIRIPC